MSRIAALRHLAEYLRRHPAQTFVLMGAAFLAFGVTSVNLYVLFVANLTLIAEYGMTAIEDGALQQFVELVGSLLLSLAFYALFVLCDKTLVRRLTEKPLAERTLD